MANKISNISVESLLTTYAPVFYLSHDEPYLPIRFDFDNNSIPTDNYYNYLRVYPNNVWKYVSLYSTYKIINNEYYVLIYIAYYVYNAHPIYPDHKQDWDSLVILVFHNNKLVNIRLGRHGFIFDYSPKELKFIENHPVIYIAQGSHGAYSDPKELNHFFDRIKKPYTVLYPLKNYSLLEVIHIQLKNNSFYIDINTNGKQYAIKTPKYFGNYLAPWFRDFWDEPVASETY